MDNEISKIMRNKALLDEEKINMVSEVEARFQNKAFINIVEEPEQNLFPTSQHEILNTLLMFNNMNAGNKLIMTTHSPYLIKFLSLAVEANGLKEKLESKEVENKLNDIVPLHSTVNGNDLSIYEFDEIRGAISLLDSYKGLPSDENKLNNELGEGNESFAKLLEIEQTL